MKGWKLKPLQIIPKMLIMPAQKGHIQAANYILESDQKGRSKSPFL